MIDVGHKRIDALLLRVERELNGIYAKNKKKLQKEIAKKAKEFDEENEEHKKAVAAGRETEAQYKQWRERQLTASLWIRDIMEAVAGDITSTNEQAAEIVNKYLPEAFATGYNFQIYALEKTTEKKSSLELEKGIPEGSALSLFLLGLFGSKLMPYMKVQRNKDVTYNMRRTHAISLQNLMGEFSVRRMQRTFGRLYDSANAAMVRNTVTRAGMFDSIGRYYSAAKVCEELGIQPQKIWVAILDNKTRHSHRLVDGQKIEGNSFAEIDKATFENGLRFPRDPNGEPAEVYNCRCDMLVLSRYDSVDLSKRRDKYGILESEEAYRRWEKGKNFEKYRNKTNRK